MVHGYYAAPNKGGKMASKLVNHFHSRSAGAIAVVLAFASFLSASEVNAQQIKIVALGGSSTYGQGVSRTEAYPAKLEAALRAKGHQRDGHQRRHQR
jgi:hypothetical protein